MKVFFKEQPTYDAHLDFIKPLSKNIPLLCEFFRYVLVGGSAFIIDIGTIYLTKTFFFQNLEITGILLATACGFISGLIYNFVLSSVFVFKKIDENAKQHKVRSFIIFTIIGITGMGLTELLMYAGVYLIGQKLYLFVKVITASVVLLWNYIARKIFIFKGE